MSIPVFKASGNPLMEYPHSRFTKVWRQITLAVFVSAFFIITPLVILTTAGYRFDWQNHFLVFKGTGSISIDIRPSNATAYLNGIHLRGSMPYRLNALTPDTDYTLRVVAPDYYDWQKNVSVKPNETFYLKDIAMLKKTDPLLIATGTIDYLSVSPNGQTLLYGIVSSTSYQILRLDTLTNQKRIILNLSGRPQIFTEWQPNGQFATLQITANNQKTTWYLYNLNSLNADPIQSLINFNPEQAQWNTGNEPELYLSISSTLYLYRPLTNTNQLIGTLPTPAWTVENNRVWSLKFSTSTADWAVIKDVFGFATTFTRLTQNDLDNTGTDVWRLKKTDGATLLIARTNGATMKLVTANQTWSIPGSQYILSPYGNWWIIWTPSEIWTYLAGDTPRLLNRSGEQLNNIVTLDEYNTLALAWKKNTTVLYPYYLISHELTDGVTAMAADPARRELYYSTTFNKKTGLWQLSY